MFLKSKIPKLLKSVPLLLVALLFTFAVNTIQTHASGVDEGELAAFLGKSSNAESDHNNAEGGNDRIINGVSRVKTGYMVYLLDTKGNRASDKAIAFSSPGFSYHPGTVTWIAESRLGNYRVSNFDGGTAPWNLIPWEGNGTPSNEPKIKEYFLTKVGGVENTLRFITDTFGRDAALKYGEKEYILVIETLLHCQFSTKGAGGLSAKDILLNELDRKSIRIGGIQLQLGDGAIDLLPPQVLKSYLESGVNILLEYGFEVTAGRVDNPELSMYKRAALLNSYLSFINDSLQERIAEVEAMEDSGEGRIMLGNGPLVGTVNNLVRAKMGYNPQPGVFDSYINGAACEAEYMTAGGLGQQAGFVPWDGSTKSGRSYNGSPLFSNGQVTELAVGMMVLTAQGEMQTTCDEPKQPDPHEPPKESTGEYVIIKNYREKINGESFERGCKKTTDVAPEILIENEKQYQVVGWATSASQSGISSIDWPVPSPKRTGTTPSTVRLDPNTGEKTLYVLLEKIEEPEIEDYNYKLTESSITRRVWFSNPDNQLTMPHIEDKVFQWQAARFTMCTGHNYQAPCEGHPHKGSPCEEGCTIDHSTYHCFADCTDDHNCGKNCVTKTDYCGSSSGTSNDGANWNFTDNKLKLSINNGLQNDYPDILATKDGWNQESQKNKIAKHYYKDDAEFERTTKPEAQTFTDNNKNWDYVCVLLRGKDKLTVARWENEGIGSGTRNSANSDLEGVSKYPDGSTNFTVANQDSGTRKIQDYMETFNAQFVNELKAGVDIHTTLAPTTAAPHSGGKHSPETRGTTLQTPLSINGIKVLVEVYSGDAEKGVNDTSYNASPVMYISNPNYDYISGRMVETGYSISFRPYIKMKYDTLAAEKLPAYVLSEYQRQMTSNAYAEISWNEKPIGNLELFSPQWSTHNSAFRAGSVLPGGATLSLQIPKSNRHEVALTTYYPVVEGYGKQQIDLAGGSYTGLTEDVAVQLHNEFVASVVAGLESVAIEQYVDPDASHSNAFDHGDVVYPGKPLGFLDNGADKASTEDKYYFRKDGEGSSLIQSDLDVDKGDTTSERYTFFSDTSGNIRYTINNVNPKEGTGTIITGGDIRGLDARTNVINKLQKAVERHSGEDSEALTGTQWYNEAFDGVTILIQETHLTVGFIDSPERTQVLDPKLTPQTEGSYSDTAASTKATKDIFKKYFISQFRTRNKSEVYGEAYVMGRYKGETVQMMKLEEFYRSKPFYIPNATTQDLH